MDIRNAGEELKKAQRPVVQELVDVLAQEANRKYYAERQKANGAPPSMTDEQLKELAKDIIGNKVFCSYFIPDNQIPFMLGSVFMCLILMDPTDMYDLSKTGFIYEYMDKAGPRAINGYPMFMSHRYINREDAKKVGEYINKLQKAMDSL